MKSNVYVGIKPLLGSITAGCELSEDRYDYVLHPVTNSRYRDRVKVAFQQHRQLHLKGVRGELQVPDLQLQDLSVPPQTAKTGAPGCIGLLASWVDMESADADVQELSFQVLANEQRYAAFVGIKQLILAPPKNLACINRYALMVARLLSLHSNNDGGQNPVLSISLPFFEDSDPLSTWELWCTVRRICGYHLNLTISLALPRDKVPSCVLQRWLAEPVTCLLVSSSIFATNQHNYPVLNKFNQQIIFEFQKINGCSQAKLSELCVILHGVEKYGFQVKGGELAYLEYIIYLLKRGDKAMLAESNMHNLSEPRLMPPLDPFSTDISNTVYHTFEQDRTKYQMYGKAITKALQKLIADSSVSAKDNGPLVVLIAGAGRGPLVDETYMAVAGLKITQCRIIALEKSPRAALYLQKRKHEYWKDSVEIVKDDACSWRSDTKVDLCISELLGSFGCNELSPECLLNVEKYSCKETTLFVPQSYSSYIAPISAPLLHQTLGNLNDSNAMDKPWIIHNIPHCITSTKINETWFFQHPLAYTKLSKSAVTDFKIKNKCEIHGLIGFFNATLYDDVSLSILPDGSTVKRAESLTEDQGITTGLYVKGEHTPDMTSWSPIVFPLKQPFFISDDSELEVFMTRNHDQVSGKFWYEWSVSSYVYLVMSENKMRSAQSANICGGNTGQQQNQQHNSRFTSSPAVDVQKAFEQFQSPSILSPNNATPNAMNGEYDMFENSSSESGFMDGHQSGWKSVHDIHGLGVKNAPVFDLHQSTQVSAEVQNSVPEEFHVRVRTGVTEMQNVAGQSAWTNLR
ncbi:LAME_0E06172g1_1 [Lachancea meyersii CBS 8951]|uniref:Protein arginine N-methyltransferase n=1 Tax=Lachancea meyersii CBS 8951 TaxID=1266667 RepID=A0A1G4JHQ4_9SACH|nr:LAME_0E06172g1_1 [Lachancea meyersii CBS 8951]